MWCDLDNIHCLRDVIRSIGLLSLITWTATNWGMNFYSNWTCSIYTQSWICLNTRISSNPYQLNDKSCSWTNPCCGEERLAVLRTNQKWSNQLSKKSKESPYLIHQGMDCCLSRTRNMEWTLCLSRTRLILNHSQTVGQYFLNIRFRSA